LRRQSLWACRISRGSDHPCRENVSIRRNGSGHYKRAGPDKSKNFFAASADRAIQRPRMSAALGALARAPPAFLPALWAIGWVFARPSPLRLSFLLFPRRHPLTHPSSFRLHPSRASARPRGTGGIQSVPRCRRRGQASRPSNNPRLNSIVRLSKNGCTKAWAAQRVTAQFRPSIQNRSADRHRSLVGLVSSCCH
jgi:hypothetical protein